MSSCSIHIVFDGDDGPYRPGETMAGRVIMEATKELAGKLIVEQRWRTHGRGNVNSGDPIRTTLHEGRWFPGQRHEYAFALTAPGGPFTYHGHNLNIDWYLTARAEVAWKLDPKEQREFCLEPPAVTERVNADPAIFGIAEGKPKIAVMIIGLVFALVGGGIWTFLVWDFLGGVGSGAGKPIGLVLGGGICALIGGAIIFTTMRNHVAQKKLGPILVGLAADVVRRGGSLEVDLRFAPIAPLAVNRATATLVGNETVVSGSGTNKTTHNHEIHREQHVLLDACELAPNKEVVATAAFAVPEDAPFSFDAPSNKLKWSVAIHIDIPGWPDWKAEYPIQIVG